MSDIEPARHAESVRGENPVEERFEDIQRRLTSAKIDVLKGRGTVPPKWDDVIFLIEQMEGWRRLADSWAREADRLRGARNDGSDHVDS